MAEPEREIFIEHIRLGRYVKVTAVDALTGLETSILGDPRANPQQLGAMATRKLLRLLAEKGT